MDGRFDSNHTHHLEEKHFKFWKFDMRAKLDLFKLIYRFVNILVIGSLWICNISKKCTFQNMKNKIPRNVYDPLKLIYIIPFHIIIQQYILYIVTLVIKLLITICIKLWIRIGRKNNCSYSTRFYRTSSLFWSSHPFPVIQYLNRICIL